MERTQALSEEKWEDITDVPEPKTRLIGVELAALTRVTWWGKVRVPADATEGQLDAVVAKLYDDVDGGEYADDENFWGRDAEGCHREPTHDDEVPPTHVAVFEPENGNLISVDQIPDAQRLREHLDYLDAQAAPITAAHVIAIRHGGTYAYLSGLVTALTLFAERAFVFADKAMADRCVMLFPDYFRHQDPEVHAR
jgi:hypothetical protein